MIPRGPLPTVVFRLVCKNQVPLWGCLEPWEDGLIENLSKVSPEGATELRSCYAMARCALEEGQWETVSSSLLCCRDVLQLEATRVGELSYGLLLLWAEYPLAKMYQLRGGAEDSAQMLEKAVETWSEICDATKSLLTSAQLDARILSFMYTAQYEFGCANGPSEMKAQSVQGYAALMQNREDFAERELCLLLSYDYYWFGAFENSLKWIQKANRLCERSAQPVSYLRWEVYVLMKLHRFKDALSALDNLSFGQVSEGDACAKEIRCWRKECYMQMHKSSTSDGDLQEVNNNEELNELQLAMEYSLVMEQATERTYIEAGTPVKQIVDEMLTPDSTSVRSWLSGDHFTTVESHIEKLPEGPRVAIMVNLQQSLDAVRVKDFSWAISGLDGCRQVLGIIKNCLEVEAYYTILASVDHFLADLYQFCERLEFQFEKALNIRKELLTCIQHLGSSDKYTEKHYMSLVILTEYQGCPPEDTISREQVVQRYASLMGMNKEQAECDMRFWIFFRDSCLWRKLIQFKNGVMTRWEHSGFNYSLSYPHLIRCEVELILDNVTFLEQAGEGGDDNLKTREMLLRQAEDTLNSLFQRFEGQSSYEAWIHAMLKECFVKRSACATTAGDEEGASRYQDMAALQTAFHVSLVEKLGLHEVKKPSAIAVSNRTQLIQAEEHVMRQYYWVRDLLKGLKQRFQREEIDSSLAWVDLPLVQLYQMKMKNLKKSLDLRNELRDCLYSVKMRDPFVQLAIHANLHAAMYLFGRSNYPSLLDEIMDEIVNLVPKASSEELMHEINQTASKVKSGGSRLQMRDEIMNMDEFKQLRTKLRTNAGAEKPRDFWEFFVNAVGRNYWEYYIVTILLYWHFVQGDYETALDIVGLLKQVVAKHFPDDRDKKVENVVFEAECLMELNMFQDAKLVLGNVQPWKGTAIDKWPKRLQQSKLMCLHKISGTHAAVFEGSRNGALYYLRITGAYAQNLQRHDDAAYCYTLCIKIIEAAKNAPSNTKSSHPGSEIITEYRGQPGWYDHFQLGISHAKLFETKMRNNRANLWSHPHSSNAELDEGPSLQDKDFSSAIFSFQQQIKLLVNPAFIARANHEILNLYATMDESYFGYLLIKNRLKDAHVAHFNYGIADINDVKLMEGDNKPPYFALTSTEQSILEEVEAEMIRYGRRTSLQFANALYAMKGKYTESWINMLEGHKDVYAKLQKHYLNKMFLKAVTLVQADSSQAESIDEYRWNAFLYAERQRSRVLLYQFGPQKLNSKGARELWEFDANGSHAMDTIKDYVAALEKDSVFVAYNYLQEDLWIIYVVQDGNLSHHLLTLEPNEITRMKEAIDRFLIFMNPKKSREEQSRDHLRKKKPKKKQPHGKSEKQESASIPYTDVDMNQDLEYLHDLLIKPIANHLCQMELQHKLILAPTEWLTKVTFAALRDSTRPDNQKFLVQRHTISMVPSLRAFKRCNERLEALQKFDLVKENVIIALGDPEYGRVEDELPGTKTEVDDITCQFPHGSVVTLLRGDATPKNLLHWVENPSHTSSRQVIVHIGAHGRVDQIDERNSCIVLSRGSLPGGKLTASECKDHEEVNGRRSRMEYDDLRNLVDGENDKLIRDDEGMVRTFSDLVDQTIGVLKGKKNTNDKDKSKSKGKVDEELMEEGSGKEMDKGKAKVDEDLMEEGSGEEMDKGKAKVDAELMEEGSGKEMDNGKAKVDEDLMEEGSGKEMDKGKCKEDEAFVHEQEEIPIEEIVKWAEKKLEDVNLNLTVFVERPKLGTALDANPPKMVLESSEYTILALQDISNSKVPWRAELIVLSACHTSEGKPTAEGLVNLARAFMIAGVPCVVASQWAVSDQYTSVLMKNFYYNLRHGQDVATAMRSAMSRMIDGGRSVTEWAPFVIWGSSSLVLPAYLRCY